MATRSDKITMSIRLLAILESIDLQHQHLHLEAISPKKSPDNKH